MRTTKAATRWIAGAVCALMLMAPAAPAKKKKKPKRAPYEPQFELVWPGPPDKPRIRFIRVIKSSEDVTGQYKPTFVERITGKSARRRLLRLVKPYGVAVDRSGRVFVADMAQRAILIFDLPNETVTRWTGNSQFPLFLPATLAFDQFGRLFVTDAFAARIVVFSPDGRPSAGFGTGIFERPGGIAIDRARNRLYVADVKRHQVLVFDTQSFQLIQEIGRRSERGSSEPGEFAGPTNVAVDREGNLYVSDTWNRRVQVFGPDGKFLRTFGTVGVQPGNFVRPKGIAVDSEGHIYVLDAEFNNFQIFNPDGRPLLFVGSFGVRPGQFLLPTGITIDEEDRIYVVEQGFEKHPGRLQVFQYLSQPDVAAAAVRDPGRR